ncbi:hypothetical protein B0H13DRAFT_1883282 [Mycena leptocephala]|nr:hypothetical protein B0H13DRAFT_1883282 [Mycena leptocephala]
MPVLANLFDCVMNPDGEEFTGSTERQKYRPQIVLMRKMFAPKSRPAVKQPTPSEPPTATEIQYNTTAYAPNDMPMGENTDSDNDTCLLAPRFTSSNPVSVNHSLFHGAPDLSSFAGPCRTPSLGDICRIKVQTSGSQEHDTDGLANDPEAPDYTEFPDAVAEQEVGIFVNRDDEVEEMKAALGGFDYVVDDGNWGIDAYCRAVRIATDYFSALDE